MPAGSSPWRGFRGRDIWRISRSPAASLRCTSSNASAAALSFAGSPSARHIAMVQRCRSSGTIGQPCRGTNTCCSDRRFRKARCARTAPSSDYAAASRISAGTGSPGQHSCTGPLSRAYATHRTSVDGSLAYRARRPSSDRPCSGSRCRDRRRARQRRRPGPRCGGGAAHAWRRYRQLCGESLNRPASATTMSRC